MFKIVLGFIIVFGLFFFGIQSVRSMSGKEGWALTKLIAYSIICAVLTLAALAGFVLIF
jgi:cytochrome c oxidase assembly factor CtaG